MSASKLNPRVWQGEERDGGYLAKNKVHKSASSPDWRGRIYLKGVGWYWLSGWVKEGRGEPMLSLKAQEMSDEDALKWCAPRSGAAASKQTTPRERRQLDLTADDPPIHESGEQSDIPF